jgi:hypothetical protein
MRFIDLDLDGMVVRAALRDDLAPKTCEAIWNALPFAGTAVHALISGQGFRLEERIPVGELPLESPTSFRHPGQLSFYPPNEEIGFCVGESRFAVHRAAQFTPFAEIEGDFAEWAKRGDDLQFTGARPVRISAARDGETPFRYPQPSADRITLELQGVTVGASLLTAASPATVAALSAALPGSWQVTNSTWGGPVLRVWTGDEFHRRVRRDDIAAERATTFHWGNYVYLNQEDGDLRICYADGQEYSDGGYAKMTPVARIDHDATEFANAARTLRRLGARSIVVSAGN